MSVGFLSVGILPVDILTDTHQVYLYVSVSAVYTGSSIYRILILVFVRPSAFCQRSGQSRYQLQPGPTAVVSNGTLPPL